MFIGSGQRTCVSHGTWRSCEALPDAGVTARRASVFLLCITFPFRLFYFPLPIWMVDMGQKGQAIEGGEVE